MKFDDSFVTLLRRNWFKVNVTLNYLTLDSLYVTGIEDNAFNSKHFAKLEILKFRHMQLNTISEGLFNGLQNLKVFFIDATYLKSFTDNSFKQVTNLKVFTVLNCPSPLWIYGLLGPANRLHLHYVTIENCTLSDPIIPRTFAGLENIVELRLRSSHIKYIISNSFDMILGTLRLLDLSGNELTTLPRALFRTNDGRVIHIFLKNNPWNCDNNLNSMFAYTPTNVKLIGIICYMPFKYRGLLWGQRVDTENGENLKAGTGTGIGEETGAGDIWKPYDSTGISITTDASPEYLVPQMSTEFLDLETDYEYDLEDNSAMQPSSTLLMYHLLIFYLYMYLKNLHIFH